MRKSYEKLESRKGGLSERENSYKIRHLRFEEAFELNNLDLFFIMVAVIRFGLIYIYIYTFKNSTRGIIQETLDSSRHTHNKIDNLEEI